MSQTVSYKKSGQGSYLNYIARGSGKCVVLLHGSPGLLQEFSSSPLFDKIASRSRAIVIDRPGQGYSERSFHHLTVDQNVLAIRNLLKSIGAQKPTLVGHSYGGFVALRYALRYSHELSRLILIAPPAYPYNAAVIGKLLAHISSTPILGSVFFYLLVVTMVRIVAPVICERAFYPHPVPSYYKKRILPLMMEPSRIKSFFMEWKGFHKDLKKISERYGKIDLPTTIVVGAADRLVRPEFHGLRLHKAIRNSKLIVLKDAGHMIHHTHSDIILDIILSGVQS